MTAQQLFLGGRPIRLGKRIGKGGEGEVYVLEGRQEEALKLYTSPDPGNRAGKVEAMVRAGLAASSKLVSFPSAVIQDSKGQLVGFLMRRVQGHQPIHHLYGPGDRKLHFPGADYRFLVHTALNVARALSEVHSRNCVIGDINHSGILVSDRAMVALIDADSFQITEGSKEFLCAVGVPEYTPPELQGRSLSGVRRTQNHDAFGLAVIIFQLLCMGRHPFIGAYAHGEMPLEKAIAEHRFAYSTLRAVGMRPPPGTVTLNDFSPMLRAAFEAAFAPSAQRPTAAQWVKLIEELERSLKRCAANQIHYYPSAASECLWCRMERTVGVVLFPPHTPQAAGRTSSAANGFDLKAIWAAIEAVHLPSATPPDPIVPNVDIEPSAEAISIVAGMRRRWTWNGVLVSVAVAGYAGAPLLWVGWLLLGGYNLVSIFRPVADGAAIRERLTDAVGNWNFSINNWRRRFGGSEVHAARKALADAKQELQSLPRLLQAKIASYEANRRNFQLRAHLDRHRVRTATIKGVGPSLKAALTSWGVDTAQQVDYHRILAISGFGPAKANAVMAWRRQVESRFVYDARPNVTDVQEKAKLTRESTQREDQLKLKLSRGAQELRVATQTVLAGQKTVDQALAHAHSEFLQAQIDDTLVNVPAMDRLLRIGVLGWLLIIMATIGTFLVLSNLPDLNSNRSGAAGPANLQSDLERFEPQRSFQVKPGRRVRTVNVRLAASGSADVAGKLSVGETILAVGRAKSSDGRWWIAYERTPGVLGYVAEDLLAPVAVAKMVQKNCAEGGWLARTLCEDASLRRRDRDLSAAYRQALNVVPLGGRAALEEAQRAWLVNRNACESRQNPKVCLSDLYRSRIGELGAAVTEAATLEAPSVQEPIVDEPTPTLMQQAIPPRLRSNISSLITADDYPAFSLSSGESGRVSVRMHIDERGYADDCEILSSSGYRTLDETTCRLLMRRARYLPAQDALGRRVDGVATQSINWRLPQR